MIGRDGGDVAIIGGGRMGTALGSLLAGSGRRVSLWVRRQALVDEINEGHSNSEALSGQPLSEELRATTDLGAAIRSAPVVLICLPSLSFREVARSAGDALEGDHVVVHTTKGFEVESCKRMSQILRDETCALKIGALSGPTIAREIVAGHPTGALLASQFDEVITKTQQLFEGSYMRVYGGHDLVGTEIAGAFKNVVAVAAGAVEGLGYGDNAKWLIVTRGLNEMARLGVAMGADVLTFGGLAGVGDLAATCASPHSLHRQLGQRLAQGDQSLAAILEDLPAAVEAVPTTVAIQRYAARLGLELPIVRAVHGLLHEGWSTARCLETLMSIPVGLEVAAFQGR